MHKRGAHTGEFAREVPHSSPYLILPNSRVPWVSVLTLSAFEPSPKKEPDEQLIIAGQHGKRPVTSAPPTMLILHLALFQSATELAWAHPYMGDGKAALLDHISVHTAARSPSWYAPYCALIGPSGIGKSRTVHELSKTHLMVPMCLRNPAREGIPHTIPHTSRTDIEAEFPIQDFLPLTYNSIVSYALISKPSRAMRMQSRSA